MPSFPRGPLRPQRFFKPTVNTVAPTSVAPAAATLVLTGFAPIVSTPVVVTPAKASLTLAAFAPTVVTPRLVTPAKATLTLAGVAPTVTATANQKVIPPAGALTLTGYVPTITAAASAVVTPAAAQLVLTGQVPDVQGDVHGGEVGHDDTLARKLRFAKSDEPDEQPIDNRPAFVALYAAGEITEEEFVALLAA